MPAGHAGGDVVDRGIFLDGEYRGHHNVAHCGGRGVLEGLCLCAWGLAPSAEIEGRGSSVVRVVRDGCGRARPRQTALAVVAHKIGGGRRANASSLVRIRGDARDGELCQKGGELPKRPDGESRKCGVGHQLTSSGRGGGHGKGEAVRTERREDTGRPGCGRPAGLPAWAAFVSRWSSGRSEEAARKRRGRGTTASKPPSPPKSSRPRQTARQPRARCRVARGGGVIRGLVPGNADTPYWIDARSGRGR